MVLLLFSADVACDAGVFPDAAFTVNGVYPIAVTPVAPTVLRVQLFSSVGIGYPWSLNAQPNWLVTPTQVPQAGATV